MKKLSLLLFSALFAFAAFDISNAQTTATAETQIGYVNPQAVLAKMPEMRAIQQRLQNFAERKQEELLQKEQNFQNEVAAYEQKAGVISEEANQREQQRLQQLQQELQTAQQEAEAALQQRREELLGPLFTQIGTAIDSVAEEMGLTYVLNTTTSNGDLIILYASQEYQEKYDITDRVMSELGIE
ncbi:OmpH family outer membrane protein [Gracilimonas mengyeensis]|uniref:Periplasmic chaperone for outer membrane proteins Skp n=1 Tax=Gracilimonas mengyeensis TaxID=1302730 RepID=A0A521EQY9_9BACT|nr:OmpH family outer membrane protein [Gracilimonas mengyeensis]SMO86315.1 periplasmic chaperone for outer membrane proteins Skp [Gracilimonas mengyeensis]